MDRNRSRREPTPIRRTIGRRSVFFWGITLVCVAMVPAMPPEFRWVAWVTAGLGCFWSVLLSAEDLLQPRPVGRDRPLASEPDSLFAPPPPPGHPRR